MAPSSLLKSITAELLEKYVALDEKRRALESEARTIKKQLDFYDGEIEKALEENGRVQIVRGEYKAEFVEGKAAVSWKGEFIRLAGNEAATKLQLAVATKRSVEVSRVLKAAA